MAFDGRKTWPLHGMKGHNPYATQTRNQRQEQLHDIQLRASIEALCSCSTEHHQLVLIIDRLLGGG
mgnify:CR=1 FL=1